MNGDPVEIYMTYVKKIISFSDLKPNWDSYGGKTINEETRDLALRLSGILQNDENWFVVPCGSGAIHFEHRDKKQFIQIQVLEK